MRAGRHRNGPGACRPGGSQTASRTRSNSLNLEQPAGDVGDDHPEAHGGGPGQKPAEGDRRSPLFELGGSLGRGFDGVLRQAFVGIGVAGV